MDRPFGNYILHERIGIGGMGEVFRATKYGPDGFEVQVALKIILPHLAREGSFRERFSREARLAASLKHPNIVQVNGFHVIDGTPFMEMEYVQGGDLRKLLRSRSGDGGLSTEESIAVLHAVARGLEHAHSHGGHSKERRGIVHCDLNPHNILISTLGEVKVTDFGIARAVLRDSTASATVRGKLAYMSPEQMEGKELDSRTDLFSLGIIAYQLLSGQHPFERGSEAATIAAIGKAEHRPLEDAATGLPSILYEMVGQLLNPLPQQRPESAAAIVRTLEPLIIPSALSSLARRARLLLSEVPGAAGSTQVPSLTASTRPRSRTARAWPILTMSALAIALISAVFLLPAGFRNEGSFPSDKGTVSPVKAPGRPAEPAAPAERMVTLESEPPGVLILADGLPLGITPLRIETDGDGSMPDLEARLYGYQSRSFRIPDRVRDRFQVVLTPLPTGTVRISARPWARVSFKGENLGETPVIIDDVPIGRHHLELSYEPLGVQKELTLEVREGMNTVAVDMRGRP